MANFVGSPMSSYRSSPRRLTLSLFFAATVLSSGCTEKQSAIKPSGDEVAKPGPPAGSTDSIDWKLVDRAMGRHGKQETGGVQRYSMPRGDLKVTSEGVQIRPALSLGSWLAFKPIGGNGTVAMGDLVLTEREYNRVIARLEQGGVTPTAVHKHLPQHSPSLWWTHVEARGNPVKIAETVHAALSLTGTPPPKPSAEQQPQRLAIDTAAINQALGHTGKVNGGVYQVSISRSEEVGIGDVELPASMGAATVLNFQPTGGGKAAINGDFAMTADEVDGVVQALESSGIRVVALHNHMLDEQPRLFFLHFWANDDAVKLARGLRTALDKMKLARSG